MMGVAAVERTSSDHPDPKTILVQFQLTNAYYILLRKSHDVIIKDIDKVLICREPSRMKT